MSHTKLLTILVGLILTVAGFLLERFYNRTDETTNEVVKLVIIDSLEFRSLNQRLDYMNLDIKQIKIQLDQKPNKKRNEP